MPTPGVTFRLQSPWTFVPNVGTWSAGGQYLIRLDGQQSTTAGYSPSLATPTVTVISSAYGASDLVVDITFPSDWVAYSDSYYACGKFQHGAASDGDYYEQQFAFTYTALSELFTPIFGAAIYKAGIISAVPTSGGVQFYNTHGAIADKQTCALIPDAQRPSIWMDAKGGVWCIVDTGAACGGRSWNLYRSTDLAQNFTELASGVWDDTYDVISGGIIDKLFVVQLGNSSNNYLQISYDSGTTWDPPLLVGGTALNPFFLKPRATKAGWTLYRNGGTSSPSRFALSDDLGLTWTAPGSNPVPPTVGLPSGTQRGYWVDPQGIEYILSSHPPGVPTGTQQWWISISYDNGANWTYVQLPNELTVLGYFMLFQTATGALITTNGHSAQRVSHDGGYGWANY